MSALPVLSGDEADALESALGQEEQDNVTVNQLLANLPLSDGQVSECTDKLRTAKQSVEALAELMFPGATTSGPSDIPTDRGGFFEACLDLGYEPIEVARRSAFATRSKSKDSSLSEESKNSKIHEHLETIKRSREEMLPILRRVEISIPDVLTESESKFSNLSDSLAPWKDHLETSKSNAGAVTVN